MCDATFRSRGRQSSRGEPTSTTRLKIGTRTFPLLCLAVVVSACSASQNTKTQGPQSPPSALTLGHEQLRRQLEAEGQIVESKLRVDIRNLSVLGRTARINGQVTNTYEEPVSGVLYRVRLFSTDGSRTLTTEYDESDADVEPGGSTAFTIELQSMYFATVPRFLVEAIPSRIGAQPLAEPDDW